jgi:hypothetical protein
MEQDFRADKTIFTGSVANCPVHAVLGGFGVLTMKPLY